MKKRLSALFLAIALGSNTYPIMANETSNDPIIMNLVGEEYILEDGKEYTIDLEFTEEGLSLLPAARQSFTGSAGTVTINKAGTNCVSWSVVMTCPYTSLSTTIRATDLTSGLSADYGTCTSSSGLFYVPDYKGHYYRAGLNSIAYSGAIAIAHSVPADFYFTCG